MVIRLRSDCTSAVIEGRVSIETYDDVRRLLTYYEPGYWATPEFKRGLWDGKRRLLNAKRHTFPAGLVGHVVDGLAVSGVAVQVVDERPPLPWSETAEAPDTSVPLFPDQRAALNEFLRVGRGCLQLPTGSGKTELAASLFALIKPKRGLMLVDKRTLMQQTALRLSVRLNEPVGMLGAGHRQSHTRVVVATVQTLWSHLARYQRELFPTITALVIDEAHKISPNTWFKTLAVIPAPVRLGLSATIKEAARRLVVESYVGPLLYEQTMAELVTTGRIAQPRIAMLTVGGIADETSPETIYNTGVVRNMTRNAVLVDATCRAIAMGLPTLMLVVRLDHGEMLKRMIFAACGVNVPFLHGDTPLETVEREKRRLETGRTPAVIASTIFDQGQDVPAVRVLILAGAGRASRVSIQRLGRGTRRKETGENVVDVLDTYDRSCRMLRSQADERARTWKKKGFAARIIHSLDDFLPETT